MLEKNKDYVEMRVSSTDCAFTQNAATTISIEGFSYDSSFCLPDPGESYVIISKEKFDQLKKKLEECEKDYISERDKAEALEKENKGLEERLKQSQLKEVMRSRLLYDRHPWSFRNVPIEEYLVKRGFTCVAEAIDDLDATVKSYRDMFDDCEPNYVKCRIDEMKDEIEKLADDVKSWKNVTGYSTPEDYMHARLNNTTLRYCTDDWQEATGCNRPVDIASGYKDFLKALYPEATEETVEKLVWVTEQIRDRDLQHTLQVDLEYYRTLSTAQAKSIGGWKGATGCDTPDDAKKRINGLIGEVEAWESDYHHLLALTGFDNEGEIEDFLEQNNDRNKLTTVIDNLKLENEAMKAALRTSNLAMQKELNQEIDNWQKATGRIDPEAAKQYIDRLKGRLNKIHGYSVDW